MSSEVIKSRDQGQPLELGAIDRAEEKPLKGGVALNFPVYENRRDTVAKIFERYKDNRDKAIEELNQKIHGEWDDDHGSAYLDFAGRDLRGLDLKGVLADFIVFTGSDLNGTSLEKSSLYGAVFTATDLASSSLRGADMRHAVMPFTNLSGADLTGAKAESLVANWANLKGARLLGASFVGAYLIGAAGLNGESTSEASSFEGAVVLGLADKESQDKAPGHALSSHFSTQTINPGVEVVRIFEDQNFTRKLAASSNLAGTILRDLVFNRSDLTHLEAIGSIWDRVVADQIRLRGAYLTGAVMSDTSLDGADTSRAWFPGAVMIRTDLTGFRPSNMAGALFIDTDLSKMGDLDQDHAAGGALFVGKEKYRPNLEKDEELGKEIVFRDRHELPAHAQRIVNVLSSLRNQLTSSSRVKAKEQVLEAGETS
jgi:uncharacterized protein YjbI with pentapeptide repeats